MYQHVVQYYETDKMGVVHHSNYIRWMEEARVHFIASVGWEYKKMEETGYISPVVSVEAKYRKSAYFGDIIDIDVWPLERKGVKYRMTYVMKNQHGETVCTGTSEHCLVGENGRPIRLDRELPGFAQALDGAIRE